jgi:SAM-dependent methyltransferase
LRDGIPVLGKPIPYWGEVSQATMWQLLAEMQHGDWRDAVKRLIPASLHDYILSPYRAAFEDVVDFPQNARILEVGAGMGGIAAELARKYDVVAIEGVWERTQFMHLRAAQDGLDRFLALNGDVNSIPFAPEQFDAIIVNGVLEWAAMAELEGDPGSVQVRFLQRLRQLLKPDGMIYLAIENRIGWNELRGASDHSGLPYTSLLPRFLARWVCARSQRYRSAFNVGYRTYTYSYFGYRRLFRRAGLEISNTFISPHGYNYPVKMIPLRQEAIAFASRVERPTTSVRDRLRHIVIRTLGQEWFWRLTGGDFAFVLKARSGREHA